MGCLKLTYYKNTELKVSYGKKELTEEKSINNACSCLVFGMTMNGLSYTDTELVDPEDENKFLYNGKELDEDFGLNLYHYGFRLYDPVLGRFPSLDPIADDFAFVSPYNYAENEPVGSIDLWGLQRWRVNGIERTNIPSAGWVIGKTAEAIFRHPIASYYTGSVKHGGTNISSNSGRVARHVAEDENMSVGIGSERNAFRHVLWSANITSRFDANASETITNSHEGIGLFDNSEIDHSQSFEGNMGLADNIVDILNNEIGRDVGENNTDASILNIGLEILGIFKEEGLWTAKQDENGNITISRTKITQSQFSNAKKTLESLDQNGMSATDRQKLEEDNEK